MWRRGRQAGRRLRCLGWGVEDGTTVCRDPWRLHDLQLRSDCGFGTRHDGDHRYLDHQVRGGALAAFLVDEIRRLVLTRTNTLDLKRLSTMEVVLGPTWGQKALRNRAHSVRRRDSVASCKRTRSERYGRKWRGGGKIVARSASPPRLGRLERGASYFQNALTGLRPASGGLAVTKC